MCVRVCTCLHEFVRVCTCTLVHVRAQHSRDGGRRQEQRRSSSVIRRTAGPRLQRCQDPLPRGPAQGAAQLAGQFLGSVPCRKVLLRTAAVQLHAQLEPGASVITARTQTQPALTVMGYPTLAFYFSGMHRKGWEEGESGQRGKVKR